jgi:hypothetical protein
MPGRKNPHGTDNEAMREFRMRAIRERGEAVVGTEAAWLEPHDPIRADAQTRRSKHRENFSRTH